MTRKMKGILGYSILGVMLGALFLVAYLIGAIAQVLVALGIITAMSGLIILAAWLIIEGR